MHGRGTPCSLNSQAYLTSICIFTKSSCLRQDQVKRGHVSPGVRGQNAGLSAEPGFDMTGGKNEFRVIGSQTGCNT